MAAAVRAEAGYLARLPDNVLGWRAAEGPSGARADRSATPGAARRADRLALRCRAAGARAALIVRVAQLKAQGLAIIGVFHHPEDVRALVDAELVLRGRPGLDDLELEEVKHVAE